MSLILRSSMIAMDGSAMGQVTRGIITALDIKDDANVYYDERHYHEDLPDTQIDTKQPRRKKHGR